MVTNRDTVTKMYTPVLCIHYVCTKLRLYCLNQNGRQVKYPFTFYQTGCVEGVDITLPPPLSVYSVKDYF